MGKISQLGNVIRMRRQANGLSQTEVANRIGVSQATVCNWELGKGKPPDATQVSALDTLLGGITQEEESASTPVSPIAVWLFRALEKNKSLRTNSQPKLESVRLLCITSCAVALRIHNRERWRQWKTFSVRNLNDLGVRPRHQANHRV